jgi:hypothetical protein
MGATNSPVSSKTEFSRLLKRLRSDFPAVQFHVSDTFRWSSETGTVFYDPVGDAPLWSLLHEVGHVNRRHSAFHSDTALIRMEMEAWDTAKELAKNYDCPINEDYIQDCIDSYRSWQHSRSTCPVCELTGIEQSSGQYLCFNCSALWSVSLNRMCRTYRRQIKEALN